MKKFIALLLTLIMSLSLMTNVTFASGGYEALESLGDYGDIEYIYDNMEVSYDYNGERVILNKDHMTYKECEVMLIALSDEKLSFKDIKTTEAVEPTDDLFPKKGYVEFLDENDGNWIIAFDDNEVYARCIDPINKTFRHGFYKYDSLTPYALQAFFNNIVKRGTSDIEETPSNPSEGTPATPSTPAEPEQEKHENQINVYDMKQIYEAAFPLGAFGDDFVWGVCSYTRENETTPVTVAYLSFEGMEFLRVLTESEIKNNKIAFDNKRIAYFEKGTDGIEYDSDFGLTNDFDLQVNVNNKGQVEYAVMTYQNIMHSGAPVEVEIIDMSKYKQSGSLPSEGKISFNSKYNTKTEEEKKDNDFDDTFLKMTKDSLLKEVSRIEEGYLEIKLLSESDDYGALHTYGENSNSEELTEFTKGLLSVIDSQMIGYGDYITGKYSSCLFWLKHTEKGTDSKGRPDTLSRFEIRISGNNVNIEESGHSSVELAVKDSSEILEYIYKYSRTGFSTFESVNTEDGIEPERKSQNIADLTKTDIIEFEFKNSADSKSYISKKVSTPGKTIKGTFERYKQNYYHSIYILTLSGNLGKVSLWEMKTSSLDGQQEKFSNNIPIDFNTRHRLEGGTLYRYTIEPHDVHDLKLIFRDNDIYEVYFDSTKCSDLKYTQLTDDKKLAEEFIEKDKEAILREAQECADTLYDFGLFKGTDKGYELEKSLTREESATILVRLLGEEDKVKADDFDEVFVDVDKDRWSYAYVMYCYEHNITKGTGADTFSPDVQIDANQFITLMMRLLGYSDVEPDTALEKSVEYKLLPEEKIDELTKKKVFTRSDMVQIVYNSLKTQMDDETVFADYLLEKGILTEKEIEQIK